MRMFDAINISMDWLMVAGTAFFAYEVNRRSCGRLREYTYVFVILAMVHALGATLQQLQIGPQWAQHHLHAVGSSVAIFPILVLGIGFGHWAFGWWKVPLRARDDGMVFSRWFTRINLLACSGITLTFITFEVLDVTLFRAYMLRKGYSGELDLGDIAAFTLGYAMILWNHLRLKKRTLILTGSAVR